MLRTVIAFVTLIGGCAGAVAQDGYRDQTYEGVLKRCVRHFRCDTAACAAAVPCDPETLTPRDAYWFSHNGANEVRVFRNTPEEFAAARARAQVRSFGDMTVDRGFAAPRGPVQVGASPVTRLDEFDRRELPPDTVYGDSTTLPSRRLARSVLGVPDIQEIQEAPREGEDVR